MWAKKGTNLLLQLLALLGQLSSLVFLWLHLCCEFPNFLRQLDYLGPSRLISDRSASGWNTGIGWEWIQEPDEKYWILEPDNNEYKNLVIRVDIQTWWPVKTWRASDIQNNSQHILFVFCFSLIPHKCTKMFVSLFKKKLYYSLFSKYCFFVFPSQNLNKRGFIIVITFAYNDCFIQFSRKPKNE